ncbi:Ig domain protein group 2 domain protein [Aquibacillus rhizosphaerae]|uniref:Ig domain protein group 2 domain protein n=1 Tax=Aquibacillus rhizosphaerae TaxID=3051431 RepID=UPI0038B34008
MLISLVLVASLFGFVVPSVLAESPTDPAPEISPPGNANGKSVLFDNAHGQTAGAADWVIDGAFSDFADAIADEGYFVKELRKEGRITLSDLSNYEVFVIPEANIPFSTQEQQALLDYVDQGGSIFFIADHYNADRNKNRWDSSEVFNGYRRGAWNDPTLGMSQEEANSFYMTNVNSSDWLSNNFGIRIRYNALGNVAGDIIVSPQQSFDITENVTEMTMHAGSTLAITDPNKAKGIVYVEETTQAWSHAVDQGVYNGGGVAEGPYVAISKPSLGKVAVIGDSSPVEDITPKYKREENGQTKTTYDGFYDQDNHVLLTNLINWLAEQETYTSFDQVSGLQLDQPTDLLTIENPQTSTEPEQEPWATPSPGYNWWDNSTFSVGSYGYNDTRSEEPPTETDGTENFESGSKGAYAAGNVSLDSGEWHFDNALLGTLASDKKSGSQSARIRSNGKISMNFDVESAHSVTVSHANFGSDTGAAWSLQKSTDGGSSWTNVAGPFASNSSLEEKTVAVEEAGTVRFKIVVSGTSGKRVNIDNFTIEKATSEPLEEFDTGSKGAYAAGNINLASGNWHFDNALLGNLSSDKKDGSQSARIRSNGAILMNFDVNRSSTVTLSHANFGEDSGAAWSLQKSTDGGNNWTNVAGPFTSNASLEEKTISVNETDPVRFKIAVNGNTGKRINIDKLIVNP